MAEKMSFEQSLQRLDALRSRLLENAAVADDKQDAQVDELLKIHPNAKLIIAGPKEEERTQFEMYKPVIVK